MKLLLPSLLWLMLLTPLYGQLANFKIVGDPVVLTDEIAAVRDPNGRFCAAIQIISELDGFSYDANNGVVRVDDLQGKDMVYLTPDERVLEIYRTGYEPFKVILPEAGIRLREKQVWQIRLDTENENAIKVTFLIDPFDARLYLDGRFLGKGTTFQIAPGSYRLKLAKPGYQTMWQIIKVDENNAFFRFTLKEGRGITLQIETQPGGADVYIDNSYKGVTPYKEIGVRERFSLKIEKKGYVDKTATYDLSGKTDSLLSFDLRRAGSLHIVTQPEGAEVILDGEKIGNTPYKTDQIEYGEHTLQIKKDKYETIEKMLIINASNPDFTIDQPLVQKLAKLDVQALPMGAILYLNDEKMGPLPQQDVILPYGEVKVTVNSDGYYAWEETVQLKDALVTPERIELVRKSRATAVFRSIIPGAGQYYSDREGAAALLAVSGIGSIIAYSIANGNYTDKKDAYLGAKNAYLSNESLDQMASLRSKMTSAYDAMNASHSQSQLLLGVAGAIWVYNLVDAWVFFPATGNSSVKAGVSGDGATIQLQYAF
jgi:hypothetical protein